MIEIPPAQGPPKSFPPLGRHSRPSHGKVLWVSLGISALLHFLALILYSSLLIQLPSVTFFQGPSGQLISPDGTELVNIRELPDDPDLEVLPPEEEPEPEVSQPPIEGATPGGEEAPSGGAQMEGVPAPTAAERLRPRAGDLRLWAPVDPEIIRLTEMEIMRLLLLAELEDAADSMALAEELARRAMDWTHTDEDGKRWGVSPGKIHLGDITLPMPFGFGASPWAREQSGNRVWAWDDIERGAARKGVQDVWKERAEAIRRRRDAERRPDTTGIRR